MLRVQGLDKGAGTGAIVALAAGLAALAALLLAAGGAPHAASPNSASEGAGATLDSSMGELPLAFEPNAGRGAERVDFLTHTAAGTVMLGGRGATLVPESGDAIALRLAGARDTEAAGRERLPGVVNDLRGDQSEWRTGLPTFESVRYAGVYPGIAIDWYGAGGTLEYDFRLAAGADPDRIAIRAAGADNVRVAANGDLVIDAGGEAIRQAAPVAYQRGPAGRDPVDSAYRVVDGVVGFELGAYDRTRPVVIDPLLLDHSTYFGGASADTAEGIAVDDQRAAYVVGTTASTNATFNVTPGVPQNNVQGGSDIFVAKLPNAAGFLEYSTYIGGDNLDQAADIAVDSAGAAYVTGLTVGTTFDVTVGAHDSSQNGGVDAFVTKLSPDGSEFEYSTFLGGTGNENGRGIAVDGDGDIYVAGDTSSTDYPVAGEVEADGGDAATDAFVTKLSPDATAADSDIAFSTYVGGSAADAARAIAVDPAEAAYVVGETSSIDFNTQGEFDGNAPGDDAFALKLAPSGSSLTYSTYLSGTNSDGANDVAVDSTGAAFVAGHARENLETTAGAIQSAPAGGVGDFDAFVTKINPAGSARAYATYLGGTGGEFDPDIALGPAGSAFLYGDTASTNFPTTAAARLEQDSGGNDLYVAQINSTGTGLHYSTYLGGGDTDLGDGIAVDETGEAMIAGQTSSTDFDTELEIEGDGGDLNTDAIIAAIQPRPDLAATIDDSPDPVEFGDDVEYEITVDNTTDNLVSTGVEARVNLPNDAVYKDAASDARCEPGGAFFEVVCDLGDVVGSDPAESLTVTVTAPDRGSLATQVEVAQDQSDPVGFNDFELEGTTITQRSDLAVAMTDSADPVLTGGNYTYGVTVDNLGDTSTASVLFATLPAGVTYRDAQSSPACNPDAPGTVRCDLDVLSAAAAPIGLTIAATAPGAAGQLTAEAEVFGGSPDPVAANNTDGETTDVVTQNTSGGGGGGGGDAGGGGAGGGGGGGGGQAADTRAPLVDIEKGPEEEVDVVEGDLRVLRRRGRRRLHLQARQGQGEGVQLASEALGPEAGQAHIHGAGDGCGGQHERGGEPQVDRQEEEEELGACASGSSSTSSRSPTFRPSTSGCRRGRSALTSYWLRRPFRSRIT